MWSRIFADVKKISLPSFRKTNENGKKEKKIVNIKFKLGQNHGNSGKEKE